MVDSVFCINERDLLIFKTAVLRFSLDAMTRNKAVLQIRSRFFVTAIATLILANFAAPSAVALTVPETPPSAWNKGSFGVQTSTEYFMSSANYGEGRGSYEKLINGNKWISFENQVKLRYGVTPTLSFYAGTTGNGVTATDNAAANTNKTNSAATNLFRGPRFLAGAPLVESCSRS